MAVLVVSAFGCLVSHFMFRSVQVWDKKGRATLKEEENREALYCFAIMFCQGAAARIPSRDKNADSV